MAKKTHNVAALAHGTNNAAVAAEHSEKKESKQKTNKKKKTHALVRPDYHQYTE